MSLQEDLGSVPSRYILPILDAAQRAERKSEEAAEELAISQYEMGEN
jgi:hypothetical protein